MIEVAATVIITVSSVLLFGYWFRYTCLLILSAKTTRDYAGDVAMANQLSFLGVQAQLRECAPNDLDRLQAALDRDYVLISYLLQNAASSSESESRVEARMLALHYRLMGAWCGMSRRFSLEASRRALEEMSLVVAHFANVVGERSVAGAAA
jgi:hypothetical protein